MRPRIYSYLPASSKCYSLSFDLKTICFLVKVEKHQWYFLWCTGQSPTALAGRGGWTWCHRTLPGTSADTGLYGHTHANLCFPAIQQARCWGPPSEAIWPQICPLSESPSQAHLQHCTLCGFLKTMAVTFMYWNVEIFIFLRMIYVSSDSLPTLYLVNYSFSRLIWYSCPVVAKSLYGLSLNFKGFKRL